MNIQINTYEVEKLEYILDKFIFQQQQKGLDYEHYRHIQTMIKMQREIHTEQVFDKLRAQFMRGETPSISALQRQEGIGYSRAARLIEKARAVVEHERDLLNSEYRKEHANA